MQVRRQADFRNLCFLDQFVTRTGQLQPRRRTGLKQHVHRHLMRQVKTARQMALLPPLDRREEFRRPGDVLRLFGRKRSWEVRASLVRYCLQCMCQRRGICCRKRSSRGRPA